MKWPRQTLANLGIPEEVTAFLSEVGLPEVTSLSLKYFVDDKLREGRLVLGDTYGSKTMLIPENGTVVMEEVVDGRRTLVFVNSSVQQFQSFLSLYEELVTNPDLASDEPQCMKSNISKLAEVMRGIDPKAMESGAAWGRILQEMDWLGD